MNITAQQVKNAIANANLSAVGIAIALKLEVMSETIVAIRHECYEMVEAGEMKVSTIENGTEFFSIS